MFFTNEAYAEIEFFVCGIFDFNFSRHRLLHLASYLNVFDEVRRNDLDQQGIPDPVGWKKMSFV